MRAWPELVDIRQEMAGRRGRRELLRRWAQLPLEDMIHAI